MSVLVCKELPVEIEALSHRVIGCAIAVHRELGPGLLESLYEDAMAYELRAAGLEPRRQAEIAIPYKETVPHGQRLDMIVNGMIIVELKCVSTVLDAHSAQLLSYLRAARLPLGLLFNFNVTLLREGMTRVFNERVLSGPITPLPASSPSRPSR